MDLDALNKVPWLTFSRQSMCHRDENGRAQARWIVSVVHADAIG